ncbi:MAG TPA: lytic transglycosylase domain-containing protein [Candidatus Binatia bacterium]|nr:lytic transglycosylase domain-containing protein [Candidatus Binatia bacterium]
MPVIRIFPLTVGATFLFFILASAPAANETKPPELKLAAAFQLPQLPGLSGPSADWRQWDAFFTFVVKQFGQDLSGDLKDSLGEVFLDSRYDLTNAIAPSRAGQNPVPELFLSSWKSLSPILNKALPGLSQQTASRYTSFISAADKLAALAPQASQLGLFQLTPDALRGMARLLEPSGAADPIAFNLDVDTALRNLLGFTALLVAPNPLPGIRQSRLPLPLDVQRASWFPFWLDRAALAAEPTVRKLNGWVPDAKELEAYLAEVRVLLTGMSDKVAVKSKLAEEHKPLYRQIVFAAGWQESCWRQYIKKGKEVTPLASATGDVGLMQVNRNTWRGLYDIKGLVGDIEYNGNAGGEILLQYLTRYALRKNEDKQPGGNLARATYAAYNGGPRHLTRYRAAKPNPALKKVDEAFWEKFQAVSSGREMDVLSCYRK